MNPRVVEIATSDDNVNFTRILKLEAKPVGSKSAHPSFFIMSSPSLVSVTCIHKIG